VVNYEKFASAIKNITDCLLLNKCFYNSIKVRHWSVLNSIQPAHISTNTTLLGSNSFTNKKHPQNLTTSRNHGHGENQLSEEIEEKSLRQIQEAARGSRSKQKVNVRY
jgi:hypothetical protein